MAGPDDLDSVQVACLDDAIGMGVDEVQAGRGPPVAQEAWLDMLRRQGLAEEGIVKQIDLPDGEVVGGPPPRVDEPLLLIAEWRRRAGLAQG
jgi:hypothetical protein